MSVITILLFFPLPEDKIVLVSTDLSRGNYNLGYIFCVLLIMMIFVIGVN